VEEKLEDFAIHMDIEEVGDSHTSEQDVMIVEEMDGQPSKLNVINSEKKNK
jgi:rRNA maturation protein Rpf1